MNVTMLLAVGAGGALGAIARHLTAVWLRQTPGQFPWATLAVNVVGTVILAMIVVATLSNRGLSETMRLFLATGFCGALTTYSTFSVETVALVRDGYTGTAIAYVGASLLLGFGAAAVVLMSLGSKAI